jgi:AcrR family transcriptional regulator
MKKTYSETEQKIIDAAKKVFMKYGLYGSRMQDVADEAGINKALLHYYFRSKEKLFDVVFKNALEIYFDRILAVDDEVLSVKERLERHVDRILDFYEEYPQMMLFIIKEGSMDEVKFAEKIKSLRSNKFSVISLLKEGMDKGEIKPIDPVLFMLNIHSLCIYPYLAAPVFRGILRNNGRDWDIERKEQIRKTAVEYIHFKLS